MIYPLPSTPRNMAPRRGLKRAQSLLLGVFAVLLAACSGVPAGDVAAAPAPRIEAAPVVSGFDPEIRVTGLAPGAAARIASVRAFEIWTNNTGDGWRPEVQPVIAWADITADAQGRVDLADTPANGGSWTGRDPYGPLWSGRRPDQDPEAAALLEDLAPGPLSAGQGDLFLIVDSQVKDRVQLRFDEPADLVVETIDQGRLNGVFAAPKRAKSLPALILLHGSEGGSPSAARQLATRYAGQGFAAFALNYFAWDFSGLAAVPNVHVNVPVELIDDARNWLARREEADTVRLGLYGHSKGAEFALVAASRYDWIKAVAACTPSDLVWEGYGIGDPRAIRPRPTSDPPVEARSSWSWKGEPLSFLFAQQAPAGLPDFASQQARYVASRAADPRRAAGAEIRIDQSAARFLLAGSGKDEVWASSAMTLALAERLARAGKAERATVLIYPEAGHQICGDGTYPPFLWADAPSDPYQKDPMAEGPATVQTWQAIVRFFHDAL